ncbi:MAG: phosphatase PAP2 family protein [Bacteroidota bacterium]|nr:phosphatase PAP2 family protein [Bacteroidota bacterium]
MAYLNYLDHVWFEWVQVHVRSSTWDDILVPMRDRFYWMPIYVFVAFWLILHHSSRVLPWSIAIILCVVLTDQISSNVLKKSIERIRPCREDYFKDHFQPAIKCSNGYSFPSTHASNHMGIGSLFYFGFKNDFKKWSYLFLVWAVLVGFAQVYVGVHFPSDILAGFGLGFLIGWLLYIGVIQFSIKKKMPAV